MVPHHSPSPFLAPMSFQMEDNVMCDINRGTVKGDESLLPCFAVRSKQQLLCAHDTSPACAGWVGG